LAAAPAAPAPTGWTKPAGRLVTKGFVGLVDIILDAAGREANDPDDDDVAEFGKAMGQQLGIWFPDAAMTPGKQLLISGTSIVGGMCIGSKKKPKPEPATEGAKSEAPANGTTSAHGAASTSDAIRPHA
jgi:hypothetical protein